jgi:hypothetical protein
MKNLKREQKEERKNPKRQILKQRMLDPTLMKNLKEKREVKLLPKEENKF